MSSWIKGATLRDVTFGAIVRTGAQTWPQGAPGTMNLFTVSGGNVLVTALFGIITTVPGGDPGITLGTAPTAGTAETNGIATTVAITEEVGTWITVVDTPTTNKPGALSIGAHAGNVQFNQLAAFAVAPGNITLTAANAETGAISWYLTYVVLDDAAAVVAL